MLPPPAAVPIRSLLVANRGEIAVRVIRGARELGMRTIAVYSDADRDAPHVMAADEACRLGPAPAGESYLRSDLLVALALERTADAVHPGYGFLSERADFASAVESAGLTFVGPTPETIKAMGDKTEARRTMLDAGVPVIPGSRCPLASADDARREADRIGYPVLLKAAAGGGGKGMRTVREPASLPRSFETASREADAAFGDGRLYLERLLDRPRHIEVQVLGDAFGNLIHLGERECSVQRRHQKLVEEAPASSLTPGERELASAEALKAAGAVSYRGAGTVEFLYENGQFHFLEMNTRIQVEHPVTELVTGIDLVHAQLRVAEGRELNLPQEAVTCRGHALECRITAEDAAFLPATGRVSELRLPGGPGVRWDGGVAAGQEITLHYDSLLGKLIVHAPDRELALARMRRALDEFVLAGVETSAPFHRRLLDDSDFKTGELSIRFLEERPELLRENADPELEANAALAAVLLEEEAQFAGGSLRIAPAALARPGWGGAS